VIRLRMLQIAISQCVADGPDADHASHPTSRNEEESETSVPLAMREILIRIYLIPEPA